MLAGGAGAGSAVAVAAAAWARGAERGAGAARAVRARGARRAGALAQALRRHARVRRAELVGTPLDAHENLKVKLSAKLHDLINHDIEVLREHLEELDVLQEKLTDKYNNLRASCAQVDFNGDSPLVCGTPQQPPLAVLLEYAHDVNTYLSYLSAQFDVLLEQVALHGSDVEDVVEYLNPDQMWEDRVDEILVYIAYCSENV